MLTTTEIKGARAAGQAYKHGGPRWFVPARHRDWLEAVALSLPH